MRGPRQDDDETAGSGTSRDPASREPPAGEPPVVDPARTLSPTAKRLLAAARRVLARDGYAGLTLEAITAEAGENKASIRYHFGGKDALITTLIEWLDHDDSVKLLEHLSGEDDSDARLDLLLRLQQEGCRSREENQMFFDLLPHVLRDPALNARLGELYAWYRDLDARVLSPDAADATAAAVARLSTLAIAVGDGLSMQYAADEDVDIDGVYALWEHLLRVALDEIERGDTPWKK